MSGQESLDLVVVAALGGEAVEALAGQSVPYAAEASEGRVVQEPDTQHPGVGTPRGGRRGRAEGGSGGRGRRVA